MNDGTHDIVNKAVILDHTEDPLDEAFRLIGYAFSRIYDDLNGLGSQIEDIQALVNERVSKKELADE